MNQYLSPSGTHDDMDKGELAWRRDLPALEACPLNPAIPPTTPPTWVTNSLGSRSRDSNPVVSQQRNVSAPAAHARSGPQPSFQCFFARDDPFSDASRVATVHRTGDRKKYIYYCNDTNCTARLHTVEKEFEKHYTRVHVAKRAVPTAIPRLEDDLMPTSPCIGAVHRTDELRVFIYECTSISCMNRLYAPVSSFQRHYIDTHSGEGLGNEV
ncbi:hypothetical protein DE146DRAFT_653012 [Phaeosphaeria sp. MPI-PUGE-AT-0046c]|nr:hypothetical protein DE146DRAFT_653012 [Phaeosphaeria sp. MPI-PUGE-AT-0046c]